MGWNRLVLHRELGAAVIFGSVLTWTRFLAKEAGKISASEFFCLFPQICLFDLLVFEQGRRIVG